MTLTDGTTTLTVSYADENVNPFIEKTSKRTAGGNIRSITGGERLAISARIRMTHAQYRTFINILTSNANNYFYTPEETTKTWMTSLYPSVSFPINANISNVKREWDNSKYAYVSYDVESTGYL